MKKILHILILLLSFPLFAQETQVSLTASTDNSYFFDITMIQKDTKLTHLAGAGFELRDNNAARIAYFIGGIEVLNRLQIHMNIGYEVIKKENDINNPNRTVFYYANKVILRTDNHFLLGVGLDNHNRGLFSIGYQFD